MKLGKKAMEALQAEVTGRLQAGDELVTVGDVALMGTALLAKKEYAFLRKYFSEGFMQDSLHCLENHGVVRTGSDFPETCGKVFLENYVSACENSEAWNLVKNAGATALYVMREGGVLSALWKMAEASEVGLSADLRKIPIRQETIEICERFDINPYKCLSQGSILIGIRGGEALVQELRQKGIPAAVIGQTNDGNDRLLYSGENVRYLERPAKDEIKKLPWGSEMLK